MNDNFRTPVFTCEIPNNQNLQSIPPLTFERVQEHNERQSNNSRIPYDSEKQRYEHIWNYFSNFFSIKEDRESARNQYYFEDSDLGNAIHNSQNMRNQQLNGNARQYPRSRTNSNLTYENTPNYVPPNYQNYPIQSKFWCAKNLGSQNAPYEGSYLQEQNKECMSFLSNSLKMMLEHQNSQFEYMMKGHTQIMDKLIDKIGDQSSENE